MDYRIFNVRMCIFSCEFPRGASVCSHRWRTRRRWTRRPFNRWSSFRGSVDFINVSTEPPGRYRRPCNCWSSPSWLDVPLSRMYIWWSLCTLYLHTCQVRVTVGDSSLCCTCVAYFGRELTPLFLDFSLKSLDAVSYTHLTLPTRRWV